MRYLRDLTTAIETARAVGDLLRTAFHTPCNVGPSESLDAAVEATIRKRLESAFPTYGQLGEELHHLDRLATDIDGHVFVVDPLDGSQHFERARRGPAVSIALLRQGVPVLGVVFSPLYPTDSGDLICWAEGQPLTRNGCEVCRRPLATSLKSEHTVLLAPAAEREAKGGADLVAPARFRVMPSIAYRLALVAVGDGEAAVSVNAPTSWDFAAGHALLRAVGGDLFDAQGKPLTYDHGGHGSCRGTCVGGSSAVARRLTEKLRGTSFGLARRVGGRPDPSMKGHTVADAGLLSRAQGCLLGQIAGDSLGSLVEFMSADQIARSYPDGVRELKSGGTWGTIAGQCTDDSELALALARTLAVRGTYDENAIARAYGDWYGSRPFDIGTTTSQAFSAAARARSKHAAASKKAASRSSQSNGALMRISPLGIFGWSLPTEKLAELARRDAQLSHPHQVCQDASAVLVVAIQHALKTGDDGAKVYGFVLDWSKKQGICHDFFQSMVDAEKEPPIDFQLHMGWCRTALRNAFFQLLHAKSFEAGVVDTVARGGDTDTNGAIAGALLGALHGVDAVPFQWRDRVLTCRPLAGIPGVNRPRPAVYWPTDALELAEQLLSVGHREVRQSR